MKKFERVCGCGCGWIVDIRESHIVELKNKRNRYYKTENCFKNRKVKELNNYIKNKKECKGITYEREDIDMKFYEESGKILIIK